MTDKFITVVRDDWTGSTDYTLMFTQHYAAGGQDSYPIAIIASLEHQPEDLLRKVAVARHNLGLKANGRQLVKHEGLTVEEYVKGLEAKV